MFFCFLDTLLLEGVEGSELVVLDLFDLEQAGFLALDGGEGRLAHEVDGLGGRLRVLLHLPSLRPIMRRHGFPDAGELRLEEL